MVLLAMCLPVVLSIAAFVINAVYLETARTELQIATDLASRASGRTLAVTSDSTLAIDAADRLLASNPCLGQTLTLADTEITFGASTRQGTGEKYDFRENRLANALKIQSFGSDDVPMLFPTFGVPINLRPTKDAIVTQLELDICVVMDRSGSMADLIEPLALRIGQPAPTGSHWRDAVASVQQFCDSLAATPHNEHLGLCTYALLGRNDHALTNEYSLISKAMNETSSQYRGGATGIGQGILTGIDILADTTTARPWASRILIVMTDGRHNTGMRPAEAAQLAADKKITIYTITFSDQADIATMKNVAAIGLGQHYHAEDRDQLVDAFTTIIASAPTLISH